MKSVFQNKIFLFSKKPILIGALLFISTMIEIYWSMGNFSERMSSGNPNASFFDDAYLMSLFTTVFLVFLFLLLFLIKNNYLKITLQLLLLVLVWFFWNYTIFVDRESSWSTYTFKEELLYTLSVSVFPTLTLSIVTVFVLNYILKSHEIK
jgi:hypothetical protein